MRIAGADIGRRGGRIKSHARLFGRASALAPVARHATRDDVLPVLAAALRHRYHVIEREFLCGEDVGAVLAFEFVSRVDVGAREGHIIEAFFYPDVPEQPDDRRQLEGKRDSTDLTVVMRDDLDLALDTTTSPPFANERLSAARRLR